MHTVALVLIPCLIVDPVLSSRLSARQTSPKLQAGFLKIKPFPRASSKFCTRTAH
jgi:hypothetical protein